MTKQPKPLTDEQAAECQELAETMFYHFIIMYIEIAKVDVSLKMPFMHAKLTNAVGSFIATAVQVYDNENFPEGVTTKQELKDFLIQQAFDRILAEVDRILNEDEVKLQNGKEGA